MEDREKSEQEARFQRLNEESSQALNQRKLDKAIELCDEALALCPDNLDILQRKAIACSMRGDADALEQFTALRERAHEEGRPVREGDVLRDFAFALLRIEEATADDLDQVEQYIDEATILHSDDMNRQAVLEGARGRLAFARGDAEQAAQYHQNADDAWLEMGEEANERWKYNNYLPYLRATLALDNIELSEEITLKIASDKERFTKDHCKKLKALWQNYQKTKGKRTTDLRVLF